MKKTAQAPGRGRRVVVSIALVVALVLLPLALYVWGSHSGTFAVRQVVLQGTDRVGEKRAAELLEKAFIGRNLFGVRAEQVERTLAPLLFMKSAGIDRDFPSTLRVRLTEYEPGLYALSNGRWYLASSDGVVLGAVARERRAESAARRSGPADASLRLPAVIAAKPLRPDRQTRDVEVCAALRVVAALPNKLAARVVWLKSRPDGIRLQLRDGPIVDLGPASSLAAKSYSLRSVLEWYSSQSASAQYVDVSVPDRPVARPVL